MYTQMILLSVCDGSLHGRLVCAVLHRPGHLTSRFCCFHLSIYRAIYNHLHIFHSFIYKKYYGKSLPYCWPLENQKNTVDSKKPLFEVNNDFYPASVQINAASCLGTFPDGPDCIVVSGNRCGWLEVQTDPTEQSRYQNGLKATLGIFPFVPLCQSVSIQE